MAIWAIADLHLSFGTPNKSMDIFGDNWKNHAQRVETHWRATVANDDLVLIPGDISWAKLLTEAAVDLKWIDSLPGTKLLMRGNHDYWWGSMASLKKLLPPSVHAIHNTAFEWKGVAIGGTRLWDSPEYSFGFKESEAEPEVDDEKIFVRELHRLEMSLQALSPTASTRIGMTHYPPIGPELKPSRASVLLEKYRINICVFGHLHNIPPGQLPFGTRNGVKYLLTSCDYLQCAPLKIWE